MNVYFNNFCPGFDEDVILTNIFVSFFSRVFCREISISKNFDNCEIMCESVFQSKPTRKTKYNFLYSGENILVPNIDQFDVVFSHISTFGKFVEFPLFMLYNEQMSKNHRQIQSKNLELKKNKVLCFIRNGSGTFRNKFLNVLDQYIQVDYAGNYRKNIECLNIDHGYQECIEFMSEYKFVIAMEKTEHGYITKKIINPLMAGVIPIYWGSKKIHDYFNPDRILTVENEDDFIPIIKKIKELMEDNQKYSKVIEQPIYQPNSRTLDTIVEETKKVIIKKEKLNCFKKIFCINLEHRTDRLNEFVLRYPCDRSQVEFFKAIDGKLINKYDLDIFETSLKNVKYSDGTLGCWISHYRIWNIISNDNGNDSELYAIFEDDAHFPDPENFKKTIESLAEFKDNFDIVYPGGTFEPFYNGKNDEMILVPELQNKIIKIYKQSKRLDRTTHFYILSKRGAKKILGLLDFSFNAVDHFLESLSLDRFEILPHLTYSPRDYKTDIQPPPMKIDVESYLTYRNNLKPGDKYY